MAFLTLPDALHGEAAILQRAQRHHAVELGAAELWPT
jgi:hypothetical protein